MKERILELANKAGAEVKIIHGDILYISKADLDIEKFAELIVRECAEVAACNAHVSGWELGDKIKQHFGLRPQP